MFEFSRKCLQLFLILAIPCLAESKLPLVAVLPMDGRGLTSDEASVITDLLGTELMRTGSFRVMERSQMDNVLKEQGFQKSGACDNSQCAVEMGQLLGIDRMVVGSIGKVGRTYLVNVRMVNVGTGEVVRSVSRTTQGDIDELLMRAVPQVANELAEKPGEPLPMRPAIGPAPAATLATAPAPARPLEPATAVQAKSSSWGWWVAGGVLVLGGGAAAVLLKKDNSSTQGNAPDQSAQTVTRTATFSWNP
jgi:TolB-like protein